MRRPHSAWRLLLSTCACLLLSAQVIRAQPAGPGDDGSLTMAFDEALVARDFAEIQVGEQWQDAFARAEHAQATDGSILDVRSTTSAGTLNRRLHGGARRLAITWQVADPPGNPATWRFGWRVPVAALGGARCEVCLFYARADQTIGFDLTEPDSLPSPLGDERAASINMTVKSVLLSTPERSLRVDLDRHRGAWQLYWRDDELVFAYRSTVSEQYSTRAAARLTHWPMSAPEGSEPQPLHLLDWLDRRYSLTPWFSKRGLYHEGEAVHLRLTGVAFAKDPRPVDISYRVTDYHGDEVDSGSATVFRDGAIEDTVSVALAPGKRGIFRVEVTGPGDLKKEVTFGLVPKSKRVGDDADSIFGTHANLMNPYFPGLAEQMGMRWTRMWGGNISGAALWSFVEPQPGRFRWDDRQIDRARRHNLNILGLLGGRYPKWIERGPREWTDEDLAAWSRYCFETVSHYKDRIHYWEIWNEPYFTFDGESYARLLKAAYEAAKRADPSCTVVGTCGPPWSTEWFDDVFAAGGLEHQDIVSAHLYPPGGGNGPLDYDEAFRGFVGQIREVMRKHGPEKELWDTEAGMTPAAPFNRLIKPHYFRHYGTPVPVDVATDMAARLYIVHLAENVRFFYYLLHGSFEYDSALCENDGAPLPSAVAIAISASMLDGAEFVRDIKKGPIRAYAFGRGDEGTIALWGVDLHGRRPTFSAPISPKAAYDVMGNDLEMPMGGEGTALPISPSPLYLTFARADLEGAIQALDEAPAPELVPLAAEVKGIHDELLGPALALEVRNFQPEPTHFTVRFRSLPDGWGLSPQPPFGEDREYVVHGERAVLFPIAPDANAAGGGDVEAILQAGEMQVRASARVALPAEPPPRPSAPHQPDAPLLHRDVRFIGGGPWTAQLDTAGLGTLYLGPDPLLTGFYFYVARRGVNVALLSFRKSQRRVEELPNGTRVIITGDNPPNGRCRLTAEVLEDECSLHWELSVAPTEDGWGELGFYIPEEMLNGGYPCEVEVTGGGATHQSTLSSEEYPMKQSTGVSGLAFRSERANWGLEIEGGAFKGSHGWHFQDFRDNKGRRDRYRVVLSFSAVEGFDADITVRVRASEAR